MFKRILDIFKKKDPVTRTIYTVCCPNCSCKFYSILTYTDFFILCPLCANDYFAERRLWNSKSNDCFYNGEKLVLHKRNQYFVA